MIEKVQNSLNSLLEYCEAEHYKGYDPYDGLNSKLFNSLPFISKSQIARLVWIQLFKRLPINLRFFAGIKKEYNAKALGLFLSGYCNLYKYTPLDEYLNKIKFLSEELLRLTNKGWSGSCWGYNFDWQARAFFLPKNTPTVVATTFIGCSLIDAYEITGDPKLLHSARSACDFLLKDLNRNYDDDGNFAFSYSPLDKSIVFNATLLGSRLLSKVFSITHEEELIFNAEKSVAYCCGKQKEDGSWVYGTLEFHQWVDNFHTGYNLECIAEYIKYSGDNSYKSNLSDGYDYYLNNFFTKEGICRYYNNSTFPIDIHAPAQMIITLSKLNKMDEQMQLIERVLNWTIENMQAKKGYFYFQINKYFSSKIPYMRWAQAWMFYGLSEYILKTNRINNK